MSNFFTVSNLHLLVQGFMSKLDSFVRTTAFVIISRLHSISSCTLLHICTLAQSEVSLLKCSHRAERELDIYLPLMPVFHIS